MNYIARIKLIFFTGATVFLIFIWLDEILDIPYLFLSSPSTPINWQESAWESVLFILIATICTFMVRRVEKRIRYLEGLNVICSHCRKVRQDTEWLSLEQWLARNSDIEFSHGLCCNCLKELYPERYEKVMETAELSIKKPEPPAQNRS